METVVNKKTEALTKIEKKALKEYRKNFKSDVECANAIGIDRNVLIRVMAFGSAHPATVAKIRLALAA